MAEPSPNERYADLLGESPDPAIARLLRDVDTLWASGQPPAALDRAITRLAHDHARTRPSRVATRDEVSQGAQSTDVEGWHRWSGAPVPLPTRHPRLRQVLQMAAAIVALGLVAVVLAAVLRGRLGSTGSGSPGVFGAAGSTATPAAWAAPGTIRSVAGSRVVGRAEAQSLPSGELAVSIEVTVPADAVSDLTWALVEGRCTAWAEPGSQAGAGKVLYQFIAPQAAEIQAFRVTTPAPSAASPLALTATRRDSGALVACADLAVEPYQAVSTPLPEAAASCPVTRPPNPPFIPPSGYPAVPPWPNEFWYGTTDLFVLLPNDGAWLYLANHDGAYTQKVFWGRQGYDVQAEPQPDLTVTGRRLDAPAPLLTASDATNAASELGSTMLVGVDIPSQGCWEITGYYQGHELTFVVWVGDAPSPAATATPGPTSFAPRPRGRDRTGDATATAWLSAYRPDSPRSSASQIAWRPSTAAIPSFGRNAR